MRHLKLPPSDSQARRASSLAVSSVPAAHGGGRFCHACRRITGEGSGEGTAWFRYDPQNNTFAWTVEFTGIDAQAAGMLCADSNEFDINLTQADGSTQSPMQGQVNNLGTELTDELNGGECRVVIRAGQCRSRCRRPH